MRIYQVDAFTRHHFTGNPATVVLDADALDEAAMQAIAREFAQAEVAFAAAAVAADHDVRLRFFNTRKEAPFVGHATIAAHAALLAAGRRGMGIVRQRSGTGIIEVCVRDDDRAREPPGALIEFRQSVPELDAPLPPQTAQRVAAALGVPGANMHAAMPTRVARKGAARLLLPVHESRTLDALMPDFAALEELGIELAVDGFFVFSVTRDAAGLATDSRMFCPALGIPEDPVSGNAHAMLAAYLWMLGEFRDGAAAFLGRQGRQLNRPGEVSVRLAVDHGGLQAVHIGGRAVIVSEGTLAL